ncbi:hypothetical protein MXD62_31850 [Frankia sp. Mgl5]|uniref:hypothetical protein n=1 Tax=Frankia sp. Mgl5 TaxID=2933793 RepID=UPI00200FC7DA|nr:hypothetical protein [Frankia sp. Mgl5]MCK9931681.1 hypothetical protein [Frankia sp. Mgl5]
MIRRAQLAVPAVAMLGALGAVAVPAAPALHRQARSDATVSSAAIAVSAETVAASPGAGYAAAAVADGDTAPASGEDTGDHQDYTIGVRLAKDFCNVYWNLDSSGERSSGTRGWIERATVPAPSGHGTVQATVGWRYNVNDRWALIASRRADTPYWGFIERSCLVDPPSRLLSGHANGSGWSAVNFRPSARATAGSRHVTANATVRSGPNGYVIGNLRAANGGDVFEWSHHCGNHGPWIFGWASRANTWGWILARDIGNPCAPADFPQATGSGSASTPTSQPSTPDTSRGHEMASTAANPATRQPSATGGAPAAPAPASSQPPAAPASAPAPAAPPPASADGSTAQCYPQYTVTDNARARVTRAGDVIGDVAPGARVNVRSNDGVWMYGYISQINGGAGGFGWLLDEKVDRTGTFCG